VTLDRPDTIIVVASELASFYEFVKPRQETGPGSPVVLLDRRQGARRREAGDAGGAERRRADRRAAPTGAAQAQLAVFGFTILHRDGDRYAA
jgi:hypothetical protein